ncbi:DUF418 domain-containing protein [Nocardia brasiliensis]|uniref:DUF418 domain-containing protein n=1 Tax=Nocardia brasiliensis TaxID=37326 RepID=UPI002453BA0B|nr:DUF418 domain-containing protein [Nocardia brasiliensis]
MAHHGVPAASVVAGPERAAGAGRDEVAAVQQGRAGMTPAEVARVEPADGATARAAGRLIGVDLARGIAVLGMFAAHLGPIPDRGGVVGFVMELAHGRSSALFAFLAGFSIVLITGRRVPKTGRDGRQAVVKVLIRAGILLVVGTGLTALGTPVEVILAYYGLYFVLALPLSRLRATALAVSAVLCALVLPQIWFLVTDAPPGWFDAVDGHDPLAWASGRGDAVGSSGGLIGLLFTGSYPALTWLPFVLAGMAVARLDLSDRVIRRRVLAVGIALAVLGYGGSAVALRVVPGTVPSAGLMDAPWWSDLAAEQPGWREQLVAVPHSETTLSIVANTGVAIAVLIACVLAGARSGWFRRVSAPLIAVGTMSLTAYVFHIVAVAILGFDTLPADSLPVLLGLSAIILMFAYCWTRFFARGPLEWLLHRAPTVARRGR